MSVENAKGKRLYAAVKRVFDDVISFLGILITFPLMISIAILIKVQDGGSVIYVNTREGKGGKAFPMYKFRTMLMDADKLERWFSPAQLAKYKNEYKLVDDPRITKIGRFLRRTSLDELPQLVNVLKGQMSLVGPRPIVARETAAYGVDKKKLLSVKPGTTG